MSRHDGCSGSRSVKKCDSSGCNINQLMIPVMATAETIRCVSQCLVCCDIDHIADGGGGNGSAYSSETC